MKHKFIPLVLLIFFATGATAQNVGVGTNAPGSKLTVSGSFAAPWATKSSAYTLTSSDYFVSLAGASANTTFTLPAALASGSGNYAGRQYVIKNATTSYTLTVAASTSPSAELIDGAATITVLPGNTLTLISNGSTGAATTWNVVDMSASSGAATGWSTTGNTGTTAGTNYMGTTDATNVQFKTNATQRMTLWYHATDALLQLNPTATGNWARIGTNSSPLAFITQGSDNSSTSPSMFINNTNTSSGSIIAGGVGINTTSPAAQLDVEASGTASYTTSAHLFAPSLTTSAFTQARIGVAASNYNSGEYRFYYAGSGSTSNYIQIGLYGQGGPVIAGNNYVGINGITAPQAPLDVIGTEYIRDNATLASVGSGIKLTNSSGTNFIESAGSGMSGSADLYFTNMNNANQWMAIKSTGLVGIGTTSPQTQLHISTPSAATVVTIGTNSSSGGYTTLSLGTSANTGGYSYLQSISSSGSSYGNLALNSSGGNVGIGTTSPAAPLDVQTAITATSASTYGTRLQQTLTAHANSDVLTGLYINPTFANGSYTSVADNAIVVGAGQVVLPNNNSGSTYKLYLSGTDLNHYIYSTGTSGNSMYFGEYTGLFNFYNTAGGNNIVFSNGAVSGVTSLSASSTITFSGIGGNGTSTLPVYINSSNQLTTTAPTSGTIGYWTASGNYIYNTNTSNIGIGFTSGTPASLLANTTTNPIGTDGNGIGTGGLTWGISTNGYAAAVFNGASSAADNGLEVKTLGTASTNHILDLSTGTLASSGTPVMVALGNGAVGIGNSSPGNNLLNVSSSATNAYGIYMAAQAGSGGSSGGSVTITSGQNGSTSNGGGSGSINITAASAATSAYGVWGGGVNIAAGSGYNAGGSGNGGSVNITAGGNILGANSYGNINFYTYAGSGTSTSQAMFINGSNNQVGIGTTSTAALLHVAGTGIFTSTLYVNSAGTSTSSGTGTVQIGDGQITKSYGSGFAMNSTLSVATGYQIGGGATSGTYLRSNGTYYVGSTIPASDLSAGISGTSGYHAKFTGSNTIGNSGVIYESGSSIGINTTSTVGAISFLTSGTNNITWGSGPYSEIYDNGNIHYYTDDQTNFESGSTGASAKWYWTVGQNTAGNASGATNWMALINGQLGIGISNPAASLHVLGSAGYGIALDAPSGSQAYMLYNGGSSTTSGTQKGAFALAGSSGAWSNDASTNDIVLRASSARIIFNTNGGGASSMAINGSYVGIGTVNPGYPLDISTTVSTSISGYGYLNGSGGTGYGSGSSGSNNFCIHANGRITSAEVDVISDSRIKTNVISVEPASMLDRANAMRVVTYNYIDKLMKGNNTKTGFIAQELEQVMPDAVNRSTDVIPNVFAPAECTELDGTTLTITTTAPHGFVAGDNIVLYDCDNKPFNVTVSEIKNDHVFAIQNWSQTADDDIFVYGKKVNDFRQVDFDQVTALSIGAIQELTKELKDAKEKNKMLEQQISDIHAENKATKSDMDKMKASIETMQQILESKAQK